MSKSLIKVKLPVAVDASTRTKLANHLSDSEVDYLLFYDEVDAQPDVGCIITLNWDLPRLHEVIRSIQAKQKETNAKD